MKHVSRKSERDKEVIEHVARRYGPLSRVEIHKLTQLRLNTISSLTRRLLSEGRLVEAGLSDNPTGRKQVLLRLNEDHSFVVGVEFNNETVIASAMNLSPKILSTVKEPACLNNGIEGLTRQLLSCAHQAISQARVAKRPLLGIGVADPGLVDTQNGVVVTSSTLDFWKQVPLKSIFEKEFGTPAMVECKTRARAIAERMLGAGRMAKDMIYVDYGRGIGAAFILDGRLLRGHRSAVGEFGHTHISEDDTACPCGSFGCLEAVAGSLALELRIRKAISEGSTSQALTLGGGDANRITAAHVLKAASLGDKTCSTIVEQAGNFLGLGLANLVNLLNPSVIVLDRTLEAAGQEFLEQIIRVVKRQSLGHSTENLEIRFANLGQEAGILGLGLMLLERYFEIPALKPPQFMIEPTAKTDGSQAA